MIAQARLCMTSGNRHIYVQNQPTVHKLLIIKSYRALIPYSDRLSK